MKNADLPAMPVTKPVGYASVTEYGLSKREMFAMAAMQGLCANGVAGSHHQTKNLVAEAVEKADALLAELERTK